MAVRDYQVLPCPDCSQAHLRIHQPIDSPSRWAEWQGESQIKDSEAGTPSPNPSQYCPRKASGWLFRCENHQGEAMLEHHLDWERWYHMELHYRIQGKRNLLLHNANYGMLWELWRRNQGWGKAGTKVAQRGASIKWRKRGQEGQVSVNNCLLICLSGHVPYFISNISLCMLLYRSDCSNGFQTMGLRTCVSVVPELEKVKVCKSVITSKDQVGVASK